MAKATIPTSAYGLGSTDLQMMRMLLAQQQAPKISIAPVQDIGGGFAQGAQNIVNAVLQRKEHLEQSRSLQNMLAQEQAMAAQQRAAEEQQQVAQLDAMGLDHRLAGSDASVLNEQAKRAQDLQDRTNLANTIQMRTMVPQVGDHGPNYGIPQVDEAGNPMLHPLVDRATAMLMAQAGGGEALSKALGELQGKQAVMQQVQGLLKPGQGGFAPIDTPQGRNAYAVLTGQQPITTFQNNTDMNTAAKGNLENELLRRQFPALAVQPTINNGKAVQDTAESAARTQGIGIENNFKPGLLQNQTDAGSIANQQNQFKLSKDQEGLNLLRNAIQSGSINNPATGPQTGLLYHALTGDGGYDNYFQQNSQLAGGNAKNPADFGKMGAFGQKVNGINNPAPAVPQPQGSLSFNAGPLQSQLQGIGQLFGTQDPAQQQALAQHLLTQSYQGLGDVARGAGQGYQQGMGALNQGFNTLRNTTGLPLQWLLP